MPGCPWGKLLVPFLFGELIEDTCVFGKVGKEDVEVLDKTKEAMDSFGRCWDRPV